MKTATFSNGHTAKYNGKRSVAAAWMMIETSTGNLVGTGFSVDKQAAQANAEQKAYGNVNPFPVGFDKQEKAAYVEQYGRGKSVEEFINNHNERRERMMNEVSIEVVATN